MSSLNVDIHFDICSEFTVDNLGEIRSVVQLVPASRHTFTLTVIGIFAKLMEIVLAWYHHHLLAVTDSKNSQMSVTAQVTVNVGMCNSPPVPTSPYPPTFPTQSATQTTSQNSPPYFTNPSYAFAVACNSQPGTTIGLVYVRHLADLWFFAFKNLLLMHMDSFL